MIAEFIWGIVNFLIYAAPFILQKIFFPNEPIPNEQIPNEPGAIIPLPVAAAIPVIILNLIIYLARRKSAPMIDYEDMDFQELDTLCAALKENLDMAYMFKTKRDRVASEGWNPDALKEIVMDEWAKIRDQEAAAILFDGDHDQEDWYNLLDKKYRRCLPPIVDLCEDFVFWVGKNKIKSEFFTVGEGRDQLIPRRRFNILSPGSDEKCEACKREIEAAAPRCGVTYGDDDYYFCCPRCRSLWMEKGDGRYFRDAAEYWDEWSENDDGESDYWQMRRLRVGYLARR